MLLRAHPPLHFSYCMNVHPGERVDDMIAAIAGPASAVKSMVSPSSPMGLGLRISAEAATCLRTSPDELGRLREALKTGGFHAFTANIFPYGRFHGARVKETVYAPDWSDARRMEYTIEAARALSALASPGSSLSLSTLPGSFRPWIRDAAAREAMAGHLCVAAQTLEAMSRKTGTDIHLALEPEPACFVETTAETIAFMKTLFRCAAAFPMGEEGARKRLGICFDTCHVALQFEDLCEAWDAYVAAGIRISKVQMSAALSLPVRPESLGALRSFDEPVYLHQTLWQERPGVPVRRWLDLPEALAAFPDTGEGEIRCHFHVPLFWAGDAALQSTARLLTPAFFQRLVSGVCEHMETETYTWSVLPRALRDRPVEEGLAEELRWGEQRLAAAIRASKPAEA